MASTRGTEPIRFSPRSLVIAVAIVALTAVGLGALASSERVIGWIVAAAAIAGILYPAVALLERFMPRGLAVLAVALVAATGFGLIGYGTADSIVRETKRLQQTAPVRAERLEQHSQFSAFFTEIHLAERTRTIVDGVPQRLAGGTPAEAIRSAATRGIAFLATGVLAIFFLLHGRKIAEAGFAQLNNPARRKELQDAARDAFVRGFGYARGAGFLSIISGGLVFGLARWAEVPGAAALAVWVGLWDLIPSVGLIIGALPVVGLAAASEPSQAVVIFVVVVAWQIVETLVLRRALHKRTVQLGPFLSAAAAFGGLELYGLGGIVFSVLALAVAVAVVDDFVPE